MQSAFYSLMSGKEKNFCSSCKGNVRKNRADGWNSEKYKDKVLLGDLISLPCSNNPDV